MSRKVSRCANVVHDGFRSISLNIKNIRHKWLVARLNCLWLVYCQEECFDSIVNCYSPWVWPYIPHIPPKFKAVPAYYFSIDPGRAVPSLLSASVSPTVSTHLEPGWAVPSFLSTANLLLPVQTQSVRYNWSVIFIHEATSTDYCVRLSILPYVCMYVRYDS